MFSAMCDIFADEVYKGTMILITCNEHEDACQAADLWPEYGVMQVLMDFYRDAYTLVHVVSYVKKVL